MNSHKNARLGFTGRACLVERVVRDGWTAPEAAGAFGVSDRTVRKWLARFRAAGLAGLADRSSRPHGSPRRTGAALERRIVARRDRRQTAAQIAAGLGLPRSTGGDVLRRLGRGRLPPAIPRLPVVRYEREQPGELLHIDAKKLGRIGRVGHRIHGDRRRRTRGLGWECLHVAIDDASRVAYAELLPDETAPSAVAFLRRAVAWLAALGVRVERVMTDNAFCYTQRQYADALAALAIRHERTRPYTPRTSGKAERFIQTALREWAYVRPYRSSHSRAGALGPFLAHYNTTRPHTAHDHQPPLSRLANPEQPLRLGQLDQAKAAFYASLRDSDLGSFAKKATPDDLEAKSAACEAKRMEIARFGQTEGNKTKAEVAATLKGIEAL